MTFVTEETEFARQLVSPFSGVLSGQRVSRVYKLIYRFSGSAHAYRDEFMCPFVRMRMLHSYIIGFICSNCQWMIGLGREGFVLACGPYYHGFVGMEFRLA